MQHETNVQLTVSSWLCVSVS